jgi:hypothetical protein
LSLDTIAQQVKGIIEGKEKKTTSRGTVMAKGKAVGGKSRAEARPVEGKSRPIENKGRPENHLAENRPRPVEKKVKVIHSC